MLAILACCTQSNFFCGFDFNIDFTFSTFDSALTTFDEEPLGNTILNQFFFQSKRNTMQQKSLLPFILKGTAEFVDSNKVEMKETDIKIHMPNSVLGSTYSIPESNLSSEELARHKRNLTMFPLETSFSNQPVVPFNAYESIDGYLYVPRFYGLEHWGQAVTDTTSEGEYLNTTFKGTLNHIQKEAVENAISRLNEEQHGGLLVLPCGYGKTVCALHIASIMKRRTLVLVHKAFLVEQWQERAQFFLEGVTVGKIQQNIIQGDCDIVIGMVQSISKREYPENIMKNFGLVIIDEAHHMSAPVFHKALRQIPAKYIIGLSATPERKDGMTKLLYWSMGSICHRIERKPEHTLVSCILYEGGKRKEILYKDGRLSMPLMLNSLVNDTYRNNIISQRIFECYKNNRHVIVLTDRIIQLKYLHKYLEQMGVQENEIGYYIGTTHQEERNQASSKKVLLSTYSMAKEGLDIPRLDTVVFATPKGDVIQSSGRVQRKHAEKNTPLIIDIIDTFSVFEKLRWKRWAFYRREGFMCQTYTAGCDETPWFT